MPAGQLHSLELLLIALLFFVVLFAALARKIGTPYPIVLVVAGLFLSFLPGIPRIELYPDVVFLLVLPPLLYSGAWLTNWRDFKSNLTSILFLAIGLVGFTVVGVAQAARWVFPGFTWQLGLVLGAVVSTTDAIAATAIAKRLSLPQRIVDIIEGESLVNDATGLLALEVALNIVVRGQTPTPGASLLRLLYLIFVGIAIGLLAALFVKWFEQYIDDGPIEIVISILIPYTVYLAAESVRASGVLAVVACGLYLSRQSSQMFSPSVRLQAFAVWDSFTFVINGLTFVLIGLQLPYVLAGIHEFRILQLLRYGALFSAIVILLRLLWVFPGAHLGCYIRTSVLKQTYPTPPPRQIFIIGWTGMRGVVALAAALALPELLDNGQPFPQRNLIVFLTFAVILVTLVLQGLTLPPLIRALGLCGGGADLKDEEEEARRAITSAALNYLEALRGEDQREFGPVYDDISHRYARRLASLSKETQDGDGLTAKELERYRKLMSDLLRVERKTAVQMRNDGRINDEILRKLEHELDLSETRLTLS